MEIKLIFLFMKRINPVHHATYQGKENKIIKKQNGQSKENLVKEELIFLKKIN